jgi:NAD(P)H-hydrate epimerase
MKYSLDAAQMKLIDDFSINSIGIPSIVLMERAALAVANQIRERYPDRKAAAVCGSGNNGADALCCVRILHEWGYDTAVYFAADLSRSTEQLKLQKEIADNLGIKTVTLDELSAYDVIVDGIFGIGLSREITGELKSVIDAVNALKDAGKIIFSVDVPSGISSQNGAVLGSAVRADYTVTFGYMKNGLLVNPGAAYAGRVVVCDCGFALKALDEVGDLNFYYEKSDIQRLPKRKQDSNKGTYGKVLVIAGSSDMCGAAYFAAKAAYRMGAGLVRILTSKDNREPLKKLIPEAVLSFYDDMGAQDIKKQVDSFDYIVMGPGLSTSERAKQLVIDVLDAVDEKNTVRKTKLLLDADALNILAANGLVCRVKGSVITPHMGEMSRLSGCPVDELKADIIGAAKAFAQKYKCICVLKDARSVVSDGRQNYINVSGNSGMSTAGSGDVLTGIIAGAFANGMDTFEGAVLGTYIHGCAGDAAASELGEYFMKADDIAEHIKNVICL